MVNFEGPKKPLTLKKILSSRYNNLYTNRKPLSIWYKYTCFKNNLSDPRVDNKNNDKDPTRFHFSLSVSHDPPQKIKIKTKKKFFYDHPPIPPSKKKWKKQKNFNHIAN